MHRRYEHINIPIEVVRTLVAVADYGSFSRAGDKLSISQPAVSAHIKRLQAIIGDEVFERTSTGMTLTECGRLAVAHARKLLGANDQILALGGGTSRSQALRIGICALYATEFMTGWSATSDQPVSIRCARSADIEKGLDEGYVDVACILNPSSHSAEVAAEWSEEFSWARSRTFVISPGSPIPLVTWPDASHQQPAVHALEMAGLSYRIAFISNDGPSRAAAVRSGLGVTAAPTRHIADPLVPCDDYYLPKLALTKAAVCIRPGVDRESVTAIVEQLALLAPGKVARPC